MYGQERIDRHPTVPHILLTVHGTAPTTWALIQPSLFQRMGKPCLAGCLTTGVHPSRNHPREPGYVKGGAKVDHLEERTCFGKLPRERLRPRLALGPLPLSFSKPASVHWLGDVQRGGAVTKEEPRSTSSTSASTLPEIPRRTSRGKSISIRWSGSAGPTPNTAPS